MPDLSELGWLLLLGGWAALDGGSLGQFMVSRPLVSGTLAGWILGDPASGLLVGALLEAAHLGDLPVGAARLPEPGPAAVPAVLLAIAWGGPAGVAWGVALGAGWSLLAGSTVVLQRRLNGRIMAGAAEGRLDPAGLARHQGLCIGADGLRGIAVTALGLAFAIGFAEAFRIPAWPFSTEASIALLAVPGAMAAGVVLRGWRLRARRGGLLVVGLGAGLALAALV